MQNADQWDSYPAKRYLENRSGLLEPGIIAYSQIIRPKGVLDSIPPFQLSYFNSQKGEYVTLKTNPVPITVSPDENAATGIAQGNLKGTDFSATPRSPDAKTPEASLEDILTIRRSPGNWQPVSSSSAEADSIPLMIHIAGGAALVLMGIVSLIRKLQGRPSRPKTEDNHMSSSQLMTALERPGQTHKRFYSAVREFLLSWEEEHPGTQDAAR